MSSISAQLPHLQENGPICEVVITLSFLTIEKLRLEKQSVMLPIKLATLAQWPGKMKI